MAIQLSVAVRNARGNAIESTVGTSAKLQIWSGSAPASCAAAATGTKLAEFALASDWANAFASGAASPWLIGLPLSTTGLAANTAGYYRFTDTAATTCHKQGTVTATGGGGDATIDNTSIAVGQAVNVTGWSITESNA
jgi:hypothetical protein